MRSYERDFEFNVISLKWLEVNRIRWKASTYSKYYYIVNSILINQFSSNSISDLCADNVQEFANRMYENGLEVSTIKEYINVINNIISFAQKNQCNCKHIDIIYPKKRKKEIQIINKKEQIKLTNYLLENIDLVKLGILLALYTGVRCGELCALKWDDIDLHSQVITINKTMQRIQCRDKTSISKTKVIIMSPKTFNSERIIPIPNFIVQKLSNYKTDKDAFFLTGTAEYYIEPRSLQNKFNKYIKQADIPRVNFHALRHTFATRCIELGFDTKSLSEILGHANVNITMNLYVHSSFDLKIENMNKLNQLVK